jgi:hypothetical protein
VRCGRQNLLTANDDRTRLKLRDFAYNGGLAGVRPAGDSRFAKAFCDCPGVPDSVDSAGDIAGDLRRCDVCVLWRLARAWSDSTRTRCRRSINCRSAIGHWDGSQSGRQRHAAGPLQWAILSTSATAARRTCSAGHSMVDRRACCSIRLFDRRVDLATRFIGRQ